MAARKIKVNWEAIWKDFRKWYYENDPGRGAELAKVQELVDAQLAKKQEKKAKPKKT